MKNLINSILEGCQLKIIKTEFYEIDTWFAYFEEKEDFFIFLYCSYQELIQKINSGNHSDVEYALNVFVHNLKKDKLKDFINRKIDHNLSLIIVMNSDDDSFSSLHKIEENSILSKKYILMYNNNDLEKLKEQIEGESNITDKLNGLAITHSNLLQSNDESWYRLLLRLFIKMPFFNYISNNESTNLENLEKLILEELNSEQQTILDKIINDFDADTSNIESFIISNFNSYE